MISAKDARSVLRVKESAKDARSVLRATNVAFNSPARNHIWGSRSMGGRLARNQQMTVQLRPLPPSSPGRPLRSRRQFETLDKHVRLVLLAPSVTVAEWIRRATVNRTTRVQFSPVTPKELSAISRSTRRSGLLIAES